MATLDASIPLQVRAPQFDNPQDIRAKALTIGAMQRQADADARAQAETQTIRDLYRQNTGADGTVNSQGLINGVANAGLGDRIPGMQKANLEAQKLGTETEAGKLKLTKDKIDGVNGILAAALSDPNTTQATVSSAINRAVDLGYMTPAQGAQAVRTVGPNPRDWLMQRALEGLDHAKQIDLALPKRDEQDRGGTINEGTVNQLTGVRTAGTDVQKTLTPGEVQGAANVATMAGAGVQYQTDANGNIIALPSKPQLGQPITPRNVTNAAGANVAGKGLNDSQSKALLFASRGQAANKILEDLASKGVNRPSVIKQGAESIPVVGGMLGAAANATVVSPEQQQVEQAQRDFINATLRRESGATIQPTEFDNANKQYFVQIGDTPEVIAQKKQNRELAMRGILAEVPEGMRGQIDAPAATTGARPPLDTFFKGKR
jgi:hypothetical protein